MTLPITAVETAIAQCTSRWAMARGHCFNTSIVLAAVHGLFREVSVVKPSLFRPLPPVPVPNKPLRFCDSVDVKLYGQGEGEEDVNRSPALSDP